ncbi:MAG: uracil-DNA glycosylase [Rhodobiaceae bacterium]|nr:uracil-DNA glycosylase [Rhodobiaceae bacterium]
MTSPPKSTPPEAPLDCPLCPRLVDFRTDNQTAHPDWFNAPVPSFGADSAKLLVMGLAPGLQGANRTGRPFTGDWAGDLLYPTLLKFGFAKGTYDARPDDGLELIDCMISNAVRCVPPQNKPIGAEMKACRPFLDARISALPNLKVIIALGRIAHENTLTVLNLKKSAHKFGHNSVHTVSEGLVIIDSYHCSRYNTNTGRLTEAMFHDVFANAKSRL